MDLWAVTMVRDELDILPYTLAHLEAEGVTGIIVADNGSTDGTWEWLSSLNLSCGLHLERDHEIGYYQSRKMTRLARVAFDVYAADWVIPFDADELWFNSAQDKSLQRTLAETPQSAGCLQADLRNHFPTSADPPDEPNPFLRISNRDFSSAPLPKVIVRNNPGLVIAQGNHDANGTPPFPKNRTPIQVAHFPWRSPDQFVRKVVNGHQAYRATTLPEEVGAHWRGYGELLQQHGPEAVKAIFTEWFHDPAMLLEQAPPPWARTYKT